jgi:hypothetical protein
MIVLEIRQHSCLLTLILMLCNVSMSVLLAIIFKMSRACQGSVYPHVLLITILIMLRTLVCRIVQPEHLLSLELAVKVVLLLILPKIHPLFLEYVLLNALVGNLETVLQGHVFHNVLQAILVISLVIYLILLVHIFVKNLASNQPNSEIL